MNRPRHVDPYRPPSRLQAVMVWLATNRAANLVSRVVGWRLDPVLLQLTRGRLATTLVIPTEILETVGARSGQIRRHAVIYFHDGPDRVIIAASHAGAPHHPAWFHNLCAKAEVTFAGAQMRAAVVEDPVEIERLWSLADRVFPAYAAYRDRATKAGRSIPLIALTPADT